jgi:Arylsulfotransferase (ASST)
MSRTRVLITLFTAVTGIAAAAVLGTGALQSGRKASSGGSSPACLPATLEHSAKLEGLPVSVSPAPETDTANPHTQISFLGLPVTEIHEVSVEGGHSGHHSGHLHSYSQGDGASFVPDTPFDAGERVIVRAVIGAGGSPTIGNASKPVAFRFRIDTPYSTATVPEFPNPPAAPADYQSFDTLPGVQAPILSVTVADRDPGAGDILTTNGPGPGRYGPLIYTPQGRLVWFHQLSGAISAENLNVQSYEGHPNLSFWQGKVLSLGFGQGEDIVMNNHYQTVARIPGANGLPADLHDFQIAPHSISYTTAYNPIRCDLSSVGGAPGGAIIDTAVQEIDMKTGLVRWEWHSLDHVGAAESETTAPTKPTPWDWFHLNSIDVEGGDANQSGNIFISARSTWAGYQLEGGTGKILWRLGGTRSSFKMGSGTETAWQHDGRVLSNGEVTFFDNGSSPPIHHQSRAVQIALDFKTHQARLRSVYTHPNPLLAVSQGNVQTLADGNALVGYGAVPAISEYSRVGSLLYDAHLPLAMDTYRAFRFPWNGRPLSPPTVLANLNSTDEETIVHASWNGASEVASWRVLAGEHPQTLQAQSTFPASDFESSTSLPKRYSYVAVQALDSATRVLGSSQPAKVTPYAASTPTVPRSG